MDLRPSPQASPSPRSPWPAAAEATTSRAASPRWCPTRAAKVTIADFKYDPETIRVKAGGTVTWSNTDQAKHNAQTDDGAAGEFDTKDLEKGDSKKVTFDEAGEFAYYCIYHRFMEAKVEVVE